MVPTQKPCLIIAGLPLKVSLSILLRPLRLCRPADCYAVASEDKDPPVRNLPRGKGYDAVLLCSCGCIKVQLYRCSFILLHAGLQDKADKNVTL